ncbi:SMI1/KNR4 family protein [Streptomyces sp. NBC_00690]|uniref:SMI1/KNR4 family protein n=1 Tax=Streptomyces sp. NBC_00690 TaxID=2975808 RepID=UPI002E2AC469|nr:SMI1/KNR4 family protein [Streptomyces sp. NBC_00690]
MSNDVGAAWDRVESWLRLHLPACLPAGAVPPGASDELIAEAETRLGFDLPADLRRLWRRCGGPVGPLTPEGEVLLGVRQALDAYDLLNHPDVWETTWIPFTADEPDDPFAGTFIDAVTGLTGSWNRQDFSHLYDDGSTLTGYLTEAAEEQSAVD